MIGAAHAGPAREDASTQSHSVSGAQIPLSLHSQLALIPVAAAMSQCDWVACSLQGLGASEASCFNPTSKPQAIVRSLLQDQTKLGALGRNEQGRQSLLRVFVCRL
jgi:hypothetical protein